MFDFLNLKTQAFGLDISDSSVKIAKLKKRGRDFDLACFGEQILPEGIVVSGDIKDEPALASLIKKALANIKGEKLNTKEAVASLPDEKTFLRVIQLPKMAPEELEKAVFFEAENHIPIPLKDSYFDFKAVEPIIDHLDHGDVLVVATPKQVVDSYSRTIKLAGLNPRVFEVESLSISRALVKNMITINPVLLVDFGETRTVLVIFAGRSIRFTSLLSFSSRQLTEDLAAGLKVSFDQAKKIKMDHGLEPRIKVQLQERTGDFKLEKEITKDEKTFEVLDSSLSQLISEIKEFLDFYYSHRNHEHLPPTRNEINKILISGGGANLKGFDSYLSKKLGISTVIGNPWTNILPEPETRIPEEYLRKSLGYSETLGLALRGMMAE